MRSVAALFLAGALLAGGPAARAQDMEAMRAALDSRVCPSSTAAAPELTYKGHCGPDYIARPGAYQCQQRVHKLNEVVRSYNDFVAECRRQAKLAAPAPAAKARPAPAGPPAARAAAVSKPSTAPPAPGAGAAEPTVKRPQPARTAKPAPKPEHAEPAAPAPTPPPPAGRPECAVPFGGGCLF